MTSGEPPRVDGEINLRGGKLDVNARPSISRAVRWRFLHRYLGPDHHRHGALGLPSGYTVYADYSGTVKAGKLTLHSEPQLTQTEIVSLLLFGTPEGSLGANDNGGAQPRPRWGWLATRLPRASTA
jgi:hypothetical protein